MRSRSGDGSVDDDDDDDDDDAMERGPIDRDEFLAGRRRGRQKQQQRRMGPRDAAETFASEREVQG